VLPLAAWLAPVFLLRFSRASRGLVAFPALAVVHYLGALVALRGIFPAPAIYLFAIPGILGVSTYALDRLLAPRLSGFSRTFVYQLACVVLDWLLGLSSLGTLGSPAYGAFGDLPLTQLVSITGIWGLVFLPAWMVPVVNEVWERGIDRRTVRYSLAPFLVALLAVLVYGGVRVAFAAPPAATVRIAGLAADRGLRQEQRVPPLAELAGSDERVRAVARAEFAPLLEDLFLRSEQQARAGANIVVWAEAAGILLKEDEPALLARAQELARREGIYLQVGLVSVLRTDRYPFGENRAILFTPDGEVAWDYFKAIHPLGDAALFAPGPGIVPVVETPYGRLATVICFDADFPALVRPAGRQGADILLVPVNDWQPVHTLHARAATFRSVENGLALVRPTGSGLSIAVDAFGRVLAQGEDFVSDPLALVAEVPVRGHATLYSSLGDNVAYLSLARLGVLSGVGMMRRRGRKDEEPRMTNRE
jgi:apolipoprotein N-acyltransferase